MRASELYEEPEWAKPCWIVAFHKTFGLTDGACKALARKHGWDGHSFGITNNTCYLMLTELLGRKPRLDTTTGKGKTPKQFGATRPAGKGFVMTKDHVMPWVNGTVSNFNGYGDDPVILIMHHN
jgi:hypothetical protein